MSLEIKLDNKSLQILIENMSDEQKVELQRNVVASVAHKTFLKDLYADNVKDVIENTIKENMEEHRNSIKSYISLIFEEETTKMKKELFDTINQTLKQDVVKSTSELLVEEKTLDLVFKKMLRMSDEFSNELKQYIHDRTKSLDTEIVSLRRSHREKLLELSNMINNSENITKDLLIEVLKSK